MSRDLRELVRDLADALATADSGRPVHKSFQPGIGPFGEADAVRLAVAWLKNRHPFEYSKAAIKRLPDLLLPGQWAVELKVVRPFGDNGKPAEHWSENVLHPYAGNTSSIGDCLKLLDSGHPERKAVVIFGFEHTPPQIPLETAMLAFEHVAAHVVGLALSPRVEELRANLVHPVHQQLRVYGYEVISRASTGA